MSHTKGKLAVNGDRIESEKDHGWANDGWIVAKCEGPDAFNNARRLAVCWNALDGVPTEWLENYVAGGAENLMQENTALVKERDELLAALRISTRGLRHCSQWNISEEKEKALMTQVIANETILAKYKEET